MGKQSLYTVVSYVRKVKVKVPSTRKRERARTSSYQAATHACACAVCVCETEHEECVLQLLPNKTSTISSKSPKVSMRGLCL